jgi:hypothetical protein
LVFDPNQSIPLAALKPTEIVGMPAMYSVERTLEKQAGIQVQNNLLTIQSEQENRTSV